MTVLAGFVFFLGSTDDISVDGNQSNARSRQQLITIERV